MNSYRKLGASKHLRFCSHISFVSLIMNIPFIWDSLYSWIFWYFDTPLISWWGIFIMISSPYKACKEVLACLFLTIAVCLSASDNFLQRPSWCSLKSSCCKLQELPGWYAVFCSVPYAGILKTGSSGECVCLGSLPPEDFALAASACSHGWAGFLVFLL